MERIDPLPSIPTPQLPRHTYDAVVIGGGQAGLSTAYHLSRRGLDAVVLEANTRLGDQWRHQYDSLKLFTTGRVNGLPGLPFAEPKGFATKDEVAGYLQDYAERFGLQIRYDARVRHLTREGSGFRVETDSASVEARNVVIATGPYGAIPSIPGFAADLDPAILQLPSGQYRRPGQLRDGPVLVVGGGASGCDIALEVAATHPTVLAGPDPGEIPVPWTSPLIHPVMRTVMFSHAHLHTRRTALGRRDRERKLHHSHPRLRVKRSDLLAAGVDLRFTRVTGAREGRPQLADGTVVDAANVIWATGCHHDYDWLDLPVLDETGWPREYRGVSEDVAGLFFCGLAYQYSLASMNFAGVGRDAAFVAERILDRERARTAAVVPGNRRSRAAA